MTSDQYPEVTLSGTLARTYLRMLSDIIALDIGIVRAIVKIELDSYILRSQACREGWRCPRQ